jgi:hypothetical protein
MIDRDGLRDTLARVDSHLASPVDLLLVGGAAMLALCEDAQATRDLDAFPGPGLAAFRRGLAEAVQRGALAPLDLNDRSRMFESLLPEGWEERVRVCGQLSTRRIRLCTPSPEDLAVMKVFRYRAKDAEDIARLAALPDFDFPAFRRGFELVLPIATGDPRYHAQSFCLAWNALRPGQPLSVEALLALGAVSASGARRAGGGS